MTLVQQTLIMDCQLHWYSERSSRTVDDAGTANAHHGLSMTLVQRTVIMDCQFNTLVQQMLITDCQLHWYSERSSRTVNDTGTVDFRSV